MSRLSERRFHGGIPGVPQRLSSPLLVTALIASVVLAASCALALGLDDASARAAASAGPELVRVLQFMAAIKDAIGLGIAGLVAWRFLSPARAALAAAAIASCALLAAGAALVWCMAHIVLGSALFYAGLFALMLLAYADRESTASILGTGLLGALQRRETRTAASVRRNGGSVQGGS